MRAVEGRVDNDDGGSEGGEAREAAVVEALEQQGQVGEGVVDGEDYLSN